MWVTFEFLWKKLTSSMPVTAWVPSFFRAAETFLSSPTTTLAVALCFLNGEEKKGQRCPGAQLF